MRGIGILDLEVPRELIEAADVPEDHVSVAAEIQGQQVIVAEPDEELPCKLGHSLGHSWQTAPQHPVQVLICVVLRVQERVHLAVLQGQGLLAQAHVQTGPEGCCPWAGPGVSPPRRRTRWQEPPQRQ